MKRLAKLFAPAGLALTALGALPAHAQVEGRIATVDITGTVIGTTAFANAYDEVNRTYKQQIDLRRTKAQESQTLLAKFDTNGDKNIDDAETAKAKQNTTDYKKLELLDQEIKALGNQIDGARIYAVEQVLLQYGAALQEVTSAEKVNLVIDPGSLLFALPEADITAKVAAVLNTKVPAVGVVPPAGWQPSRESVQIYQEIQQRLVTAQLIQQQQQQQQQGNPAAPVGR
jgi:Skp family chaperone for outer membrane proteins